MHRTERPATGQTTLHADGTVTLWSVIRQQWLRGNNPLIDDLVACSEPERARIIAHLRRFRRPGA